MDDRDLARLLSGRDGPSVLDQEADFEQLMHELDRGRPPVRWALWLPAAGALAAAALALLVFMKQPAVDEFAARGGQAGAPAVQALCVEDGAAGRCPSGGRLAFAATAGGYRYLALFARRSDGLVIWYFPSAEGQSVPIAGQAGDLLKRGIQLGDDQPPGRYELFGVFSTGPMTRDQIKRALGDELKSGAAHRVVRGSLIVEPRP